MLESISSTKIFKNNTEEAPFVIPNTSTETKKDLRVNTIVDSGIDILLEIERYYYD